MANPNALQIRCLGEERFVFDAVLQPQGAANVAVVKGNNAIGPIVRVGVGVFTIPLKETWVEAAVIGAVNMGTTPAVRSVHVTPNRLANNGITSFTLTILDGAGAAVDIPAGTGNNNKIVLHGVLHNRAGIAQ